MDDSIKDIGELSEEEKLKAWTSWIRSEVNAVLDIYLPVTMRGDINIKYFPKVVESLETGDVLDESKAEGVRISLDFVFDKTIDLNKPRQ